MASGKQPKDLKQQWQKPRTVQEFTAQVNDVATLILNGKIDLEQARAYSSLVRTVTQAMSVELGAARLEKRRAKLVLAGSDNE